MESQGPATAPSIAWLAAFQKHTFSMLPFVNAFEFLDEQHGSRKLSASSFEDYDRLSKTIERKTLRSSTTSALRPTPAWALLLRRFHVR